LNILVTGVTGFAGSHLVSRLAEDQPSATIWGIIPPPESNAIPLEGMDREHLLVADLADPKALAEAVDTARPDVVYHLAAMSSVAESWRTPAEALRVNSVGQVHLFEALRRLAVNPVTVIASSAEVYGAAAGPAEPLREDMHLDPLSPYAVSKAAQELIATQYFHAYQMPTICLRLFPHTGPGQADLFAASAFARQVAEIEAGVRPPSIRTGDLSRMRDLTDVRDIAHAYRMAADHGAPGAVYNICSGRATRIGEVLDKLLAIAGVEAEIESNAGQTRPTDIPWLWGSCARFEEATGWRPRIPLEQTLADLLQTWRARLERSEE